jgi:hypothetical protein
MFDMGLGKKGLNYQCTVFNPQKIWRTTPALHFYNKVTLGVIGSAIG